ncbi:MAG: hypothetical protein GY795_37605 [Desulfobacterales bacterium]|nr:hypothetical protein [Desulfobacterales bacterium]
MFCSQYLRTKQALNSIGLSDTWACSVIDLLNKQRYDNMESAEEINEFLKYIEDKYNQIDFFNDDQNSIQNALNSIIRDINKYIVKYPYESECYHILGVCCYHFPDLNEDIINKTEESFLKAVSIDSHHFWAVFFLGCLYFDQKRYDDALKYLSSIDDDFFSAYGQVWRDIKTQELFTTVHFLTV